MIPVVAKLNDGYFLQILIDSMVEEDLEVRRASLKALGAILCSTDSQLMATLVNFGYLENISTVITANDEELLKNALWGLSNFVTDEPSIKQFIE